MLAQLFYGSKGNMVIQNKCDVVAANFYGQIAGDNHKQTSSSRDPKIEQAALTRVLSLKDLPSLKTKKSD